MSSHDPEAGAALADWSLAERVAWTLGGTGQPAVGAAEVADLRGDIDARLAIADEAARRVTGLGDGLAPATGRVVGRRAWIRGNVSSLAVLLDPAADRLLRTSGLPRAVARRALAAQLGTVFGYLARRVLGQYEVFLPEGVAQGRLTLVGPNLLQVERELLPGSGVAAGELRLGICLHEVAHFLQFEAVPWLRPHLRGLVDEYLAEARLDPERLREFAHRASELARRPERVREPQELLGLVLTEHQREILDRAQALMTLLEGHGNVVMDWGAEVLAEGDQPLDAGGVRRLLNRRRARGGDRAIRQALGLGMKAEQYRVGERFWLDVGARYGRPTLDRVWGGPELLPTRDELADPDAWVARTGGPA
ncbi:coenzyme F420 biosynthesis-associated protein [Egibacter rhizosphaerae]|uniref:Coenzyme F420 biosynthesis-associated protein n=1 Tax=Egibacter rhizosphaerae TaxID=1670831 RepID=A0A411YDI9_9ACTN|nr:zinc-dependent metalloprotease [Egibacter rhizosphaerae]QBI19283.1 coenzyme F420 biosynthesis-associated protein [Egibacter rhizosphaerae]